MWLSQVITAEVSLVENGKTEFLVPSCAEKLIT